MNNLSQPDEFGYQENLETSSQWTTWINEVLLDPIHEPNFLAELANQGITYSFPPDDKLIERGKGHQIPVIFDFGEEMTQSEAEAKIGEIIQKINAKSVRGKA